MRFIFFLLIPVISVGQVTWQKLNPVPMDNNASDQYFVVDSSLYVVSGVNIHGDPISSVWQYQINTDTWVQKNSFDTIVGGGGTMIRDTGYIIGGWGYHRYLTSCWRYNQSADQWDSISSLPEPIKYGSTLSSMGRLFTGLGFDTNEVFLASLWEYDFAAGTWLARSPKPGGGRNGVATAVVDSFVYFAGGNYPVIPGSYLSVNDFYRYNVNQDRWDSMPPVPGLPRAGPNLYVFKNFLIVAFGQYENDGLGIYDSIVTDMYRFDFDSARWSPVTYTGVVIPEGWSVYFQYGTKCYLLGGSDAGNGGNGDSLSFFDAAALGAIVDTGTSTGIAGIYDPGFSFSLYPNPSTDQCTVRFSLPAAADVSIALIDVTSRELATINHSWHGMGISLVPFSTDSYAPGVYTVRFSDGTHTATRQLTVTGKE